MPKFGIKFNANAFAHTFVTNRAKRWLVNFLNGIGKDNIRYLVQNNKDLTAYIPREQLLMHQSQVKTQVGFNFTADEVYDWVPGDFRAIIEAHTNGKTWAYRQLQIIKETLLS